MLCLAPLLRNKIPDVKNIAFITKKINAPNLEKCQHCQLLNFNVYRLQEYSTSNDKKDISVLEDSPKEVSTAFETVKKTTKTAWYGTIVIIGLGLTGAILYELFKELFSGNSPNNVYTEAFKRCISDEKVIFTLGEPIKGYGEENRRGRRQHVSHLVYEKDGVNYMRMKFYIKGSRKTATVHLEMKENENKTYEYRYFFIQVDGYPHTTIVLEDNRFQNPLKPLLPLNESTDLLQ